MKQQKSSLADEAGANMSNRENFLMLLVEEMRGYSKKQESAFEKQEKSQSEIYALKEAAFEHQKKEAVFEQQKKSMAEAFAVREDELKQREKTMMETFAAFDKTRASLLKENCDLFRMVRMFIDDVSAQHERYTTIEAEIKALKEAFGQLPSSTKAASSTTGAASSTTEAASSSTASSST